MSSAETSSAFLKVFTMIFNDILAFNFLIESKYVAKKYIQDAKCTLKVKAKGSFNFKKLSNVDQCSII